MFDKNKFVRKPLAEGASSGLSCLLGGTLAVLLQLKLMSAKRFLIRRIKRISGTNCLAVPDQLALEEPLEIQVAYGPESARQWKTAAITMRTPDHDRELAAGIPMLVAVGAPSSLAVEVAEKFGATLIGFTKPTGFNIYTGEERVRLGAGEPATLVAHAPI